MPSNRMPTDAPFDIEQELARWQGPELPKLVRERVAQLFRWLDGVSLNELATRARVMAIIDRYVIETRPSGTLTELAGEMSQIVFTSEASAHSSEELLPQLLQSATSDARADET